ncbi:hypothetical protein V496_08834 [Pseudogymnoascus sp. VKM F-4515 (FW-2607)]|nr:hypothetical protein V496_08834 [Pseudogymnoascus sp. VKM F-4515 (FW-2607)]KFY94682.1 hypothetical protein V498_03783 [Pseudogymnoascus sp. VKM F-4517 (FW-2822)]
MSSFAALTYTPAQSAEIAQWQTTISRLSDAAARPALLATLNSHLATRTTLLGALPSVADVELYKALSPAIAAWSDEERTGKEGHPNLVRHMDFVQGSDLFGLGIGEGDRIKVDKDEVLFVKPPVDAKAEKERIKKEKAAAAAAAAGGAQTTLPDRSGNAKGPKEGAAAGAEGGQKTQKKEKKEKAPKPQKAPAPTAPLSPSLIDLRVGHIVKAIKHPEADSLYVSTIAMGDKAGTDDTEEVDGVVCRTVCSGLNGLVPLEEMQGRYVVVVCNLKPVKMRGIKSSAMVLAASPRLKEGEVDNHAGPVELVTPPEGSKAGDRLWFEGWTGEPEGILNPKKKVWEMIQPGFTTTDKLEAAFDAGAVKELNKEGEEPKTGLGKLVSVDGRVCTVKTLSGGIMR